ncbi:MAG: YezD family protein [Actinomycetota bacterium]
MATGSSAHTPEERPSVDLAAFSDDELAVLAKVGAILRRLEFGTVLLVIHEGKVVQIEMAEKFRLP